MSRRAFIGLGPESGERPSASAQFLVPVPSAYFSVPGAYGREDSGLQLDRLAISGSMCRLKRSRSISGNPHFRHTQGLRSGTFQACALCKVGQRHTRPALPGPLSARHPLRPQIALPTNTSEGNSLCPTTVPTQVAEIYRPCTRLGSTNRGCSSPRSRRCWVFRQNNHWCSLCWPRYRTAPDRRWWILWFGSTCTVRTARSRLIPLRSSRRADGSAPAPNVCGVLAVVVDDAFDPYRPTHRVHPVLTAITQHLEAAGIPVCEAWAVPRIEAGQRWRSLLSPHHTGVVADPRSSPVTVGRVLDGRPILRDRTELTDLVAPDPQLRE